MTQATTKRFTRVEYHRLIEVGVLQEGDRIELIRGELVRMAAKGTSHSVCNAKLARELDRLLGDYAFVRNQEPLALSKDSEPEPDVAIVRGRPDDYIENHPRSQDILLAIEISDTTLAYDRTVKLSLYAENQIQAYWLVNLVSKQLECYSQPYQDGRGDFGYRSQQIFLQNETVALPSFPDLTLDLQRVFPAL